MSTATYGEQIKSRLVGLASDFGYPPATPGDEHGISYEISAVLGLLDRYESHLDPPTLGPRPETMTAVEALAVGAVIDDIQETIIGPADEQARRDYEARYGRDDYYEHYNYSPTDGKHSAELYRIKNALYELWHTQYYLPRTRPATAEDFRAWLDAYVDRYGDEVLDIVQKIDAPFERVYHPFGEQTNLRLALGSLATIPAYGSRSLNTLEPDGSIVCLSIPAPTHSLIYSLSIPPRWWKESFRRLRIPNDIVLGKE